MDDFFDNQIPWDETTAPSAEVVASAREAIAERKRREAERNLRWIGLCLAMLNKGEGNA